MTNHRFTTTLAAGLAVAAVGAPVASAMPDYPLTPSGQKEIRIAPPPTAAERASQPVRVAGPAVVVEADEQSGFDWGSAAIGAAVAAAMVLLAMGAAQAAVRHHHLHTPGGAR